MEPEKCNFKSHMYVFLLNEPEIWLIMDSLKFILT